MADAHDIASLPDDLKQAFDLSRVYVEFHAYRATKNGMFLWRAFARARQAGVLIPEEILQALDGFSERILAASSHDEIAAAMDMMTRPGHTAIRRFRTAQRALRPVRAFLKLREFYDCNQRTEADLLRHVAEKHNMTFGALKRAVNRWEEAERKRQRTPNRKRLPSSVFEWGHDTLGE